MNLLSKIALALVVTLSISLTLAGCYKGEDGRTYWGEAPQSLEESEATGKPMPAGGEESVRTGQTAGGVAGGIAKVTPAAPASETISWIVGMLGTGIASFFAWNKSKKAAREKSAKETAQETSAQNFARATNLAGVVKDLVATVDVVKASPSWDASTKLAVTATQKNPLTAEVVKMVRNTPTGISPESLAYQV